MFSEYKSSVSKPSRKYTYREVDENEIISNLEELFMVRPDELNAICKHFVNELTLGLKEDGHTVKMIPSYVTKRPTGKEKGSYLALDLGGTNFRVCEVFLEGDSCVRMTQKKFTIPDDVKCGTADALFDFLADSIAVFIKEHGVPTDKVIPLGFTFSFPVDQTAIDKGILLAWTKGFDCDGTVNQDVVALLNKSLSRKNIKVKVSALVNDTVGTLMASAYKDPNTLVGVILGTGSNAAYVEKVSAIPKWKGGPVESGEMIINCEWGAFDSEKVVLPITPYDEIVDAQSTNKGQQIFEKMISGLYLGEIVRQVIVDLINRRVLFGGISSEEIEKPYNFDTAYMSRIERDHTSNLIDTKLVLQELFNIPYPAPRDRRIVRRICELVSLRAARLAAIGIAGLVMKMNKVNDGCTIAIDGSVYEHYPHFGNRMKDAIHELLGMFDENLNIVLSKDGSGVGAGVIAALN